MSWREGQTYKNKKWQKESPRMGQRERKKKECGNDQRKKGVRETWVSRARNGKERKQKCVCARMVACGYVSA